MEKIGFIELIIHGKKGIFDVNPENYDIRDIITDIEQVEHLLFPGDKSGRPIISYRIEEGSIKQIFKTGIQYIISFTAVLNQIVNTNSIDFLEGKTAKAIESFQESAIKKGISYNIRTSISDSLGLVIDKTTNFYRSESVWVDSEFYFYGKVTNAGGKKDANIHLVVDNLGSIIVHASQKVLEELEKNILYKNYGIRAIGKQNAETGEIDTSSIKLIELLDYSSKYEEDYLSKLRKKAIIWLGKVDPEKWLNEIRGRQDA
jgi:hypothetical protein